MKQEGIRIRTKEQARRVVDRRSFLTRTAAAGSWSFVHITGEAKAAPTEAKLADRNYELGTVTYNLGRNWTLEQLIEKCEETDFKAVELRSTHKHGVEPHLSSAERRAVRQRFERTPVKLACLGSACEFHSPDRDEVERNIALAKEFVKLAADVGALGVKVRPNGIPEEIPVETTLKQIAYALEDVARVAEQNGVEIWVEVHGRKSSHPPYMRKIMEYCAHPSVGITWNSNESDLKDASVKDYFDLLKGYIRNVHIHELYSDYPYKELFGLLREIGYDRWTLAEIPETTGDSLRFMRYYRKLWNELSLCERG